MPKHRSLVPSGPLPLSPSDLGASGNADHLTFLPLFLTAPAQMLVKKIITAPTHPLGTCEAINPALLCPKTNITCNKAGHTATPVACGWARTVIGEVTRAFGYCNDFSTFFLNEKSIDTEICTSKNWNISYHANKKKDSFLNDHFINFLTDFK